MNFSDQFNSTDEEEEAPLTKEEMIETATSLFTKVRGAQKVSEKIGQALNGCDKMEGAIALFIILAAMRQDNGPLLEECEKLVDHIMKDALIIRVGGGKKNDDKQD